ncbi:MULTISPECIES: phage tail tape measure protein [unclassified Anabaena]|uniref:phage tail tape measure protein n=1 Tax=unclassified Anabaena TaxID=2619674 RepID=UPI0008334D50|nr:MULTISPECIES: phage tail tape measure protein [unclassified Anabaena]
MKVAVQQEDLHLLARTLQEQFLAEVPSGEVFQIKCAVNKDELMILTQHPLSINADVEQIFAVIEEVLQSLTTYKEQRIQCFMRIMGEKLPYAQRYLMIKGHGQPQNPLTEVDEDEDVEEATPFSSSAFSLTDSLSTDETEDEAQEEPFDPLADAPDLLVNPPKRQINPILLGTVLLGVIGLGGGGAYLLTRPCVMSECPAIATAAQFQTESRQLMRRAKSATELASIQQQLEATNNSLTTIPRWSSRYQQAEELKVSLSGQAEEINQVLTALQTATVAEQKMQTPTNSQQELQARQRLWRQAIAPLESVKRNSELYNLAQSNLRKYRVNLQTINQQIVTQEKWLKKLADAKAVASVAAKRETTAKTLQDWQKVQSTWQVVINALNIIPQNSPAHAEAQQLLIEYKPKLARARDRVTVEQLAAKSYQQLTNIAKQAKAYEQQQQWQAAVIYWQQALQSAQQISRDSLYYNQAQTLIAPYTAALKQAQEKLQLNNAWQQTRADLNKTCSSTIKICNFTVDDKGIIVRITPEYDQILQSGMSDNSSENTNAQIDLNNHWQILQEALTVISDNANLPLFIYNPQGQPIYTRTPEPR